VSPPQPHRPGTPGADCAHPTPHEVFIPGPGGPSTKTFHQARSANHQIDSEESANV
jgi:hypothetical protein